MVPPSFRCRMSRRKLDGVVLGGERLSASNERHLRECLRCQAEAARYRTMVRGFAAIREEVATAPSDLVPRVMAALDPAPSRRGRRMALSVSAVSALAIAGSVALALRRRHAHA